MRSAAPAVQGGGEANQKSPDAEWIRYNFDAGQRLEGSNETSLWSIQLEQRTALASKPLNFVWRVGAVLGLEVMP